MTICCFPVISIQRLNLTRETMSCKNLDNLFRISLIIINNFPIFENSYTIETGLSDLHKMTVGVVKTNLSKNEC